MSYTRCAQCGFLLHRSDVVDGRCGTCGAPAAAPEGTELDRLRAENERLREALRSREIEYDQQRAERDRLRAELGRLDALINSPQVGDFLESVRLEAAHQCERWGSEHDDYKTDADWFWLLGYLAGKAIRPDQSPEKTLHHIVTTAAVCLNWHAYKTGARQ